MGGIARQWNVGRSAWGETNGAVGRRTIVGTADDATDQTCSETSFSGGEPQGADSAQ